MTDFFIEWEGRKFRPLELAELAADSIPEENKKHVAATIRNIRSAEEHIKTFKGRDREFQVLYRQNQLFVLGMLLTLTTLRGYPFQNRQERG